MRSNLIIRLLKEFIILPAIFVIVWSLVYFLGFPKWGVRGFWNSAGLYLLIIFIIVLIRHVFLFAKFYKSFNIQESISKKMTPVNDLIQQNKLFEISMHLSDESFVELIFKNSKASDKDFILLALLVYARIIRLMPSVNDIEEKEAQYVFMQAKNVFNDAGNKSEYLENLKTTLFHLKNSSENSLPFHIVCLENSIQAGTLYSNEINKYIYLIFLYAYENIKKQNQPLLFKSFVRLTEHELSRSLSSADAVLVPNLLVAELKL